MEVKMNPETIKILLADDEIFIRKNIAKSIQAIGHFEIVGEVSSGTEAEAFVASNRVDLVIMDVEMDSSNDGLTSAYNLSMEHPETAVIMMTVRDDDNTIYNSYCIPSVRDYVVKSYNNDELIAAIQRTVEELRKNHSANQKLREEFKRLKKTETSLLFALSLLSGLTASEKEIIALKLDGVSNRQIAKLRFVSEGTVKTQITTLLKKLGYKKTSQVTDLIHELKIEHFFKEEDC